MVFFLIRQMILAGKIWNVTGQMVEVVLTDYLAFVAPDSDRIVATAEISEQVGIGENTPETLGLVIEFDSYSGFNNSDLWEWLRKVRT